MQRRIQILPPGVAERIAAGEVIERPASVVKELVENSLDAGARTVAVALEDGGRSLIEVTDDGHGMSPDDLQLCIERHATSKLANLGDLERIHTLGFRGEALPSVAAVSELSLLSRAQGADTAYEFRLGSLAQAGREASPGPRATTHGRFIDSPHGTRIQARGLFAQLPARLKFLKSQGAEVAQTREWLERLAVAHPGVAFRLSSDGRTVLNLRAAASEAERVRAILADGDDYPIASAEADGLRLHWVQGLSTPQLRKLVQVVNGRAVRDRMLQQALLAPFRQALLPGQFPAVALYVDLDPAGVDVNVHPTKSEVRFLESGQIFRRVQALAERLITERGAPAFVAAPAVPGASAPNWAPQWHGRAAPQGAPLWSAAEPSPMAAESSTAAPTKPELGTYVGTLFNTYIAYDAGHELVLIDQHAAHERVRYEKLRANLASPSPQALLIPEAAQFDVEKRAAVEAALPWLAQRGFEAEVFGDGALLFRAVPAEWGAHDLRVRLKNLVERVVGAEAGAGLQLPSSLLDEALFEATASEACHSAIRAGDRLEPIEALTLVDQLFRCEHPWNCPHGRPTVVRVPRARLEEWFMRRV